MKRGFLIWALLVAMLAPAGVVRAATVTDSGPDADLQRVFEAIENNTLDVALERTEALLKVYPNFRLANLIKGDLHAAFRGGFLRQSWKGRRREDA
jgi:hypothetical protein